VRPRFRVLSLQVQRNAEREPRIEGLRRQTNRLPILRDSLVQFALADQSTSLLDEFLGCRSLSTNRDACKRRQTHNERGSAHGRILRQVGQVGQPHLPYLPYPSRLLDRSVASSRIASPHASSASACGQNVSRPTPFKNRPRRITRK